MELQLRPEDVVAKKFAYGKGCETCAFTGYRGRVGLFEIMVMNDELRDLIMQDASTNVLRSASRKIGMRTLREAGQMAIFEGITTIEEVVKETITEEM